jgi:hypothetical protein
MRQQLMFEDYFLSVLSLVVTAIVAGGVASRKCNERKVKGKRPKTENSGFFDKRVSQRAQRNARNAKQEPAAVFTLFDTKEYRRGRKETQGTQSKNLLRFLRFLTQIEYRRGRKETQGAPGVDGE